MRVGKKKNEFFSMDRVSYYINNVMLTSIAKKCTVRHGSDDNSNYIGVVTFEVAAEFGDYDEEQFNLFVCFLYLLGTGTLEFQVITNPEGLGAFFPLFALVGMVGTE